MLIKKKNCNYNYLLPNSSNETALLWRRGQTRKAYLRRGFTFDLGQKKGYHKLHFKFYPNFWRIKMNQTLPPSPPPFLSHVVLKGLKTGNPLMKFSPKENTFVKLSWHKTKPYRVWDILSCSYPSQLQITWIWLQSITKVNIVKDKQILTLTVMQSIFLCTT